MTKQVLLTIAGLQFMEGQEAEPVEVITAGDYYCRNGKHYVLYDEPVEGSSEYIHNTLKISKDSLEVMKKGLTNVHMVFEKDKKNLSYYATPFGSFQVGIQTSEVEIQETEENIDVQVAYALELNEEFLADCRLRMNIKSKDAGDFSLQN